MKKNLLFLSLLFGVAISLCNAQGLTPTFWGMCYQGSLNDDGNLYKMNASGNEYDIYNFSNLSTGENPLGSPIMGRNGLLYGVTIQGGTADFGTIFSYNTSTGLETILYSFGGDTDGFNPHGELTQINDSMFYGITMVGGANFGTIFSFNIITNKERVLHRFGIDSDGINPQWSLTQVGDTVLYGFTLSGGANGYGIIYKYSIATSNYADVYDFSGGTNGSGPMGKLIQVNDSLLYGMTPYGGANYFGTILKYNVLTGKETDVYDFTTTGPQNPSGSLLLAGNGLFYGLTGAGGTSANATIFSYNSSNGTVTDLHDFGKGSGSYYPDATLIQATNGLLYGTTQLGGDNKEGDVFSYDILTSTYTLLHSFNNNDGEIPIASLLEVDTVATGINQLSVTNNQLTVYPNPSSNFIYVSLIQQQQQPVTLSLYNILGQEVWNTPTQPSTNANPTATIPVTNLPDGVYILKANCGGVELEKQIVVAR